MSMELRKGTAETAPTLATALVGSLGRHRKMLQLEKGMMLQASREGAEWPTSAAPWPMRVGTSHPPLEGDGQYLRTLD